MLKPLPKILFSLVIFSLLFFTMVDSGQTAKHLRGNGIISLYNVHLGEKVQVQYRYSNGRYNKHALKMINHTLRCRYNHKKRKIRTELLELVDQIQDHFGHQPVHVVSGYRSPELNHKLWREGHQVSKNSPHMYGQAMDISIPGISSQAIRDYAKKLRIGGVGHYSSRGFVHVDIGLIQYW